MTDAELRDAALAKFAVELDHLKRTTRGLKGFSAPGSSEWGKALAARGEGLSLLAQMGQSSPLPPPSSSIVQPQDPLPLSDGGGSQDFGVYIGSAVAQEVSHRRLRRYDHDGVRIMQWPPAPTMGTFDVHDLFVEDIAANPPRSLNGTTEAGVWIGQRSHVYRVRTERCAWMGLWTGSMCDGSLFEDITSVQNPNVGIYLEHGTRNTTFRRLHVEAANVGIMAEWWYPNTSVGPFLPYGGLAGTFNIVIEDFDIHCDGVGPNDWDGWCIYLDAGTFNYTIRNGRLSGKNGIAYPDAAHRVNHSGYISIDWASIDTSGLTGQVEQVHQRGSYP